MNESRHEDPPRTPAFDNVSAEPARSKERAAFLDDFQDTPELTPLVQAFETGNYAKLRTLEQSLRKRSDDPELLDLARELVERTEPDPTSKKILLLAIGFFIFIVIWIYSNHGH